VRLVAAVAEFLVQDEGLLAQVEGLAVVTQAAVVPSEVGEAAASAVEDGRPGRGQREA